MSQDTRKDKRAKVVSLNVRYKSATIDEFIDNHSHDVSKGGVFVKTQTPFAPGTLLKFEIRLSGDQAVIAGVGRVVWKREPTQAGGPERPAGMGVKFIKVDDASRGVIDKLTGAKADAGSAYLSEPEGTFEAGESAPLSMGPPPGATAKPSGASTAPKPPGVLGGGIGVPKIPGATPLAPPVAPHVPPPAAKVGAPPAQMAPPKPAAGSPMSKLPQPTVPQPTPAVPQVATAKPIDKLPPAPPGAAAPPKPSPPAARKQTMMGLGIVNAPPRAAAPPPEAPQSTSPRPPPVGIEPLGTPIMPAAAATTTPGSLPKAASSPMMFPKAAAREHEAPQGEATVMKQAAELLEEALKEAGGSLDEIGDNPLFTGGPAQKRTEQPIAPLVPEGELPAETETGTLIMGARGVGAAHLMGLDDMEDAARSGSPPGVHPPTPPMMKVSPAAGQPAPAPQPAPAAPAPAPKPAFAAPAPETARAQVQSVPPAKKGGGGTWIALVVILLLLGGGGFAAYQMGYLASIIGPAGTPSATPSASATGSAAMPPTSASAIASGVAMQDASTTMAMGDAAAAMTNATDGGAKADASSNAATVDAGTTALTTAQTRTAPPPPPPQPRPRPRPPQPPPTATETAAPTATDTATTAPTATAPPTATATATATATSTSTGGGPLDNPTPPPPRPIDSSQAP